MFEIDALTFRHRGSEQAYDFSLSAAPGEIVGLVGPSGSGKSTLLDLVAGFLDPASGDIRLDGRSLVGLPPEERPVSILFQADNLFDHLSAAANVALGLGPRARASDAAVEQALAEMGLAGMGGRKASELSGGQRQRVALARTLLRNRPVLLLDEPFSGLDAETIAPIRDLIGALVAARGWHALLVSHQPDEITALTARRYRLEDGRLIEGS
ncbi:ATP-binding cassette domain-containing protein [Pelagibacterium montanilacus]|uniref:ATP-binding cassette domain-containing protein n=1 Tax=Pelagibacterium montanilacus TaxID=2185280 RepID=UPI000F8DC9F4|nr:ATP-binding cassette domain-containing protein [Pelagibacterium montanilacus]